MKVTVQGSQEWISESGKTPPAERVYSSAVSGEHLVSLDGVLPTQGQDTDEPGRFLLPVKGRLQGKRQGCWGRIRPSGRKREAETASSQSCPVTLTTNYPQRLWPPGHDCVCLCGCLGTRKSVSIDPIGNTGCIFGHFMGLFLFLSRAAINHFHFNFHFLSL